MPGEKWSGRQDSNLRPEVPKTSALPGCAIPRPADPGIAIGSRSDTPFGAHQQGSAAGGKTGRRPKPAAQPFRREHQCPMPAGMSGRTSAAIMPFGAGSEPHKHGLAGPQLGQPVPPQRLHVDEDVLGAVTAGEEAEPAQPVEPLHHRPLEPARRRHLNMGARGGISVGWIAVDSSIERMRNTCKPFGRCRTSATIRAPS